MDDVDMSTDTGDSGSNDISEDTSSDFDDSYDDSDIDTEDIDEDVSDEELNDVDSDAEDLDEINEDVSDEELDDTDSDAEDLEEIDEDMSDEELDNTDSDAEDLDEIDEDISGEELNDINSDDEADTAEDTADTDGEESEMTEDTADTATDDEESEMTEDTDDTVNDDEADATEKSTDTSSEMEESIKYNSSEKADISSEQTDHTEHQAASSVSEYMNNHNYGRDDFATYSQDPEWRNLMRKEYPDYELPELTQENAKAQLSDYMNSHNYGQDDIDTYSQDPAWRELQSAAYPDYELPPLQKSIDLKQDALDAVPDSRRDAVIDTFSDAPDEFKSVINDLSDELNVGDCRSYIHNGMLEEECCHYDPTDDIIRMEKNMDDGEYAEVFRHEYGHFADAKMGDLSTGRDFVNALDSDISNIQNDSVRMQQMLDDLASSEVIDDRCISDILSGSFKNDSRIIDRYYNEGIDYYHHKNSYWDGTAGPTYARERETFANLFSMYSGSRRNQSISFMEKYYPSTISNFKGYFSNRRS